MLGSGEDSKKQDEGTKFLFKASCFRETLPKTYLPSANQQLNDMLQGGLLVGACSEWGIPLGGGGRRLLLSFLASVTQGQQNPPGFCLWINGQEDLQVFPPAFFAHGIEPSRLIFAQSPNPLQDMERVFACSVFKLIVIDNPKRLRPQDCLFLSYKARSQQFSVIIMRNYLLSNKLGNAMVHLRVNCQQTSDADTYRVSIVKGPGVKGTHLCRL